MNILAGFLRTWTSWQICVGRSVVQGGKNGILWFLLASRTRRCNGKRVSSIAGWAAWKQHVDQACEHRHSFSKGHSLAGVATQPPLQGLPTQCPTVGELMDALQRGLVVSISRNVAD
eukprot:GHVU01229127.1.p2 GENE.GHVU01229127.1~~GHVU01229127.1.p2  ORF type:complete len:117 (+),score=3.67 GHVU01229127.1:343-693(+)